MEQQNAIVAQSPSDNAISVIRKYVDAGLILPPDYNYVNAIKSSIMVIANMRDKEGKTPFDTCTKISIQTALVEMAQKGLDASKKQCSFIKRGNRLMLEDEYHGVTTQIQRMFPEYTPTPRVIYEGDEFDFETINENGRRRLVKHIQKFENLDKEFVGAYLYTPCRDGGMDLYIMTRKMIEAAWSKSSNPSLSVHHTFTYKMVCKTIINSALAPIVNASDSMMGGNTPNGTKIETAEDERDYVSQESANTTVIDTDSVEYEDAETEE